MVIAQDLLKLEVGPTIYNKGEEYFKKNKDNNIVFFLKNDLLKCKTQIKNYNCKLSYFPKSGQILEKECSCPYYDNTHNLCKHLISFSLQINKKIKSSILDFDLKEENEKINLIENNIDILNQIEIDNISNDINAKADSVSQLTKKIKDILENNVELNNINVEGEISTFSLNRSGHIYFSIKDSGAILPCVMFKFSANNLSFKPKTGDKVILKGNISLYEPRGSYQLNVKEMKQAGQGDLFAKFLELKSKLEIEGLFNKEHKKSIVKFPKVLGVISSPTGAVIQDIINTVKRRFPKIKILLIPVSVQGKGSELEIIKAIKELDEINEVDSIIIARGGGSMEDLWCFNDENLARTIYNCKTPIISAIGHETDFTICDFVADIRAPTPTAAAEISVPNLEDIYLHLEKNKIRLISSLKNNLENKKLQIGHMESNLHSLFTITIENKKNQIYNFLEKIKLLSIETTLKRGYSLTLYKNKIIKSKKELSESDSITTVLSDGKLISNINKI
ncbi:MAG: exodeoxyribonuclease VII large subunit, partial [Nanoarchaeota archaeon]|nr:exodeoxyribonuclease VII large subunit [Nanoarchaeota archaeon]